MGLFYTFLLVICLAITLSAARPLRLLSIVPYPPTTEPVTVRPSYTEGPALYLASKLAVDWVNYNRSDILSNYELELVRGDGGCEVVAMVELALFEHVIYNEENVQGVVGPGCSQSTILLGNLIGRPELSLLSVSLAGTMSLEDRFVYPHSFSVIDSSQRYVNTIVKMIETQAWKKVTVLQDLSRNFFRSIQKQLEEIDKNTTSYSLRFFGLLPDGLQFTPQNNLPFQCQPFSRVIVILAGEELTRNLLCLYDQPYSDQETTGFQFIIVNHTPESLVQSVNLTYNEEAVQCSAVEIEQRLNGSILLQYRIDPLDKSEPTASGLSYNEFRVMYNESIEEYNNKSNLVGEMIEPSSFAAAYFDATWALILALNNSREELRERAGLELSEYRYGQVNATDIVKKHLLQLNINGLSGNFNIKENGFVERLVDIFQFKGSSAVRLEYYNQSSDTISRYGDEVVTYITDAFAYKSVADPVLGSLLIFLLVAVAAIVAVIQIISMCNRHYPTIKATNPKLYVFAYLGIYIEALGSIIYIIGATFRVPPEQSCLIKHAASVITTTGNVLVFSALAAIAFRVYRIFVHYMHPGKLISDAYLQGFIIITSSLCFVVHAILSIVFHPNYKFNCVETRGGTVSVTVRCVYESQHWIVLMQGIPTMILTTLATVFAALSIGHVKIKLFKTDPILIVCFVFFISIGVWILYYAIEVTQKANNPALGSSIGTTLSSTIVFVVFLFFPPTIPILRDFYNAHLKKLISPFWQRTKRRMSKYGYTSKQIASPVSEATEAVTPHITSTLGSHGHNTYLSSQERTRSDKQCSNRGNCPHKESVKVTIEVVEEVDF